jgi:uncharacterized protein YcbK (DUF882 family)
MRLSEHFTAWEFRDRHTGEFGSIDLHLVEHLELLRELCGRRPLVIVSGWRSESTNFAVGGARDSQHLYGRAADIPERYATLGQAIAAGFTGIGDVDGWAVHLDVRPGPLARWSY